MKKNLVMLLLLFSISLLFAESIEKSYSFELPTIVKSGYYSRLQYKNCVNIGKEGEPMIPYFSANLLLPANQKVSEIKIVSIEYYDTLKEIILPPLSGQFPISHPAKNYQPTPNKAVYNSDKFPSSIIKAVNTGFLSGHSIASFQIAAAEFYPILKEVKAVKKITLKISTETSSKAISANKFFRQDSQVKKRLKEIVDNPEKISTYYHAQAPKDRDEHYDVLLITNENLLPVFSDYIAYKNSVGYFVKSEVTADIYTNYEGVDNQEKIRNCIIDYYQNYGIKYVLLGGDADTGNPDENIVPIRGLTVILGNSDYDEHNLPSDMYYSNLDDNWNDDNDNDWGEVGEIDYYAEVFVGRIAADIRQEVSNFTNKLFLYQDQPVVEDVEKALMLGEKLDDTPTYGGNYKDEIADGSSNNGYITVGFPENFTVTRIYERDQNWGPSNIYEQFSNNGINLLNHLGHSSPSYNMHLSLDDVTVEHLANDGVSRGFVIGYSQGCYNGSVDNWIWDGYHLSTDCFAEKITTLATGEVASIANSRYGWYSPGATNSSSQYFDRQFFDTIFDDNITNIGVTNSIAKEKGVTLMLSDPYMRWSAFETNLFGDPSMDIWTAQPTDFDFVSYPETIFIGAQSVQVIIGTENAKLAITKDGELIGSATSDESAIVTINFDQPIQDISELTLTVTAHNKNKFTGYINVIANNSAYLSVDSLYFEEIGGIDNDLIEYGEEIGLYFSIHNYGVIDATNVTAQLSSDNSNIEIIDGNIAYDDINAANTISNNTPFIIKISDFCPDETPITLHLDINSPEGDWHANRTITISAPIINLDNYTVNGINNYLMPGDTASIIASLKNLGHTTSHLLNAYISTDDENILITNNHAQIENIASDEVMVFDQPFTFTVDENCPEIYNFTFTMQISDSLGYYNVYQLLVNIGFKETVENGENDWLHYTLSNNTLDQWHISETRSYSPSHAWKMGSTSSSNYFNNIKCALETPEMNIDNAHYFSFNHWMNAEISSSNSSSCYDGGLVEIYYNNEWQQITPIGNYPYTITGNNNSPFDSGTNLYSGLIEWENAYFDLTGYNGNVKFRFVFGTDGAVTNEGWYIDDIAIVSSISILAPPQDLTAHLSEDNAINLSWNAPEGEISHYNIYRKLSDSDAYMIIGNSAETSYNDAPSAIGEYFYVVTAVKDDDESLFSNVAQILYEQLEASDDDITGATSLSQNYPNPFNPTTTIKFNISQPTQVSLDIYNVKGQHIITLLNTQLSAGIHNAVWNGKDKNKKSVSSGVYFYKLKTDKKNMMKKMLLLK